MIKAWQAGSAVYVINPLLIPIPFATEQQGRYHQSLSPASDSDFLSGLFVVDFYRRGII